MAAHTATANTGHMMAQYIGPLGRNGDTKAIASQPKSAKPPIKGLSGGRFDSSLPPQRGQL